MRDISEVKTSELLELVNNSLQNGMSVNKFAESMGWGNSSVKTRLKRGGYKFNKELRIYEKIKNYNIITNTKENTILEVNKNNNIDNNTNKSTKRNINIHNFNTKKDTERNTKIINLELRLSNIEKEFNKIKSYTKNLDEKRYIINNTRETSTKSIRLYTEVKEQLDKYLKNHKDKKVIEIFSYAILEYMDKHK
ncbi:hypothetical protein [Clostridium sp.]|uniref:hypothetical protein n=1 Tax=Clostridium sp. TaxID=1506 RepID=UPI0026DD01BB|nr:hypothetical protein [Clostridium sp.]MDO5040114.1 hypothetical protein [Clostridium sp.]